MRPTRRAIKLFGAGVLLALVIVVLAPSLWQLWAMATVGAVAALALDAIMGMSRRRLTVDITAPSQLFIGANDHQLVLKVGSKRPVRPTNVGVLLELDPALAPIAYFEMPVGETRALVLQAVRRGKPAVRAVHLRWQGPLGLTERRAVVTIGKPVAVVPNTKAVRAFAIRFFDDKAFSQGLKIEKFLGDGTEFESLREYMPGLDHRAIDWKASARHRKLLCQEFRAERNHQVVLAFDSGQFMSEPLAGMPRVDHAINAGLLLAWLGLRTGDRVGLAAFDDKLNEWAEPSAGMPALGRLATLTTDIAYANVETNFALSLSQIATRLKRRSLVVVFSEFVDTVTAELMVENLARLSNRHLVIFVALNDPSLRASVEAKPTTLQQVAASTVATDFMKERSIVLERLRRFGVQCIDAPPQEFSVHLVNRYLEAKRRELF